MNVNITARHVDMTPALREYIESKVDRIQRVFDRGTNLQVTLDVDSDQQRAEMILTGTKNTSVVAHDVADDLYAAIDGTVDKLVRQLKRYNAKIGHGRRGEGLAEASTPLGEGREDDDLPTYQDAVDDV